jgi:hypothetical protein
LPRSKDTHEQKRGPSAPFINASAQQGIVRKKLFLVLDLRQALQSEGRDYRQNPKKKKAKKSPLRSKLTHFTKTKAASNAAFVY